MATATEELARQLRASQRTLALTGAGISTWSGIPDFRGAGAGANGREFQGHALEEILSRSCFLRHPEWFYQWALEFVYNLDRYDPNPAHRLLAGLERRGLLHGLYTQNIDRLHRRAGSRKLYELHGSPEHHHCLRCGREFGYEEIAPRVRNGEVPHCPCGGLIKPDIVFYEEPLDEALLEQAFTDFGNCELVLVFGSSLTVLPAASLPLLARRGGAELVIVNARPTPLDAEAVLKFDDIRTLTEALAKIFPEAAEPQAEL